MRATTWRRRLMASSMGSDSSRPRSAAFGEAVEEDTLRTVLRARMAKSNGVTNAAAEEEPSHVTRESPTSDISATTLTSQASSMRRCTRGTSPDLTASWRQLLPTRTGCSRAGADTATCDGCTHGGRGSNEEMRTTPNTHRCCMRQATMRARRSRIARTRAWCLSFGSTAPPPPLLPMWWGSGAPSLELLASPPLPPPSRSRNRVSSSSSTAACSKDTLRVAPSAGSASTSGRPDATTWRPATGGPNDSKSWRTSSGRAPDTSSKDSVSVTRRSNGVTKARNEAGNLQKVAAKTTASRGTLKMDCKNSCVNFGVSPARQCWIASAAKRRSFPAERSDVVVAPSLSEGRRRRCGGGQRSSTSDNNSQPSRRRSSSTHAIGSTRSSTVVRNRNASFSTARVTSSTDRGAIGLSDVAAAARMVMNRLVPIRGGTSGPDEIGAPSSSG